MLNLKDKVALITGASRGIGRATALKFAELGTSISINYLNEAGLAEAEAVAQEVKAFGVDAFCVMGDVSKFDDAASIVNQTVEHFGRIDILVNNAGITRDTLMLRMKEEDFDAVVDVNLKGAWNMMKNVTPIMLKQKSGSIVNMASVIGLVGNAGQINYAASKAGLIGMTKSLAKELAGRSIRVNALAPGFIKSDMTDKLTDAQKEGILTLVPMKVLGNVEDVANAAAFLSSDMASYITGQTLTIDGGMVM
ncbi:3-oxoacyl-[acyl-carrier-protein] reductase [Culicoidibacter larvae]|uniref:3-oxoacyl-[acyl-carrier-protein] reductase n=1 Tax=Culicoidibacter larvae TaxID=2579976 RepID=A0A5R8QH82_9FIRM|nr:3-oxoacyl-[acyl-carrier-protein] reductase [Culicoidibacter larvae]TLG77060.1 3-oxoacyl-[acyl-carrier-protein] reductase [Culicoidibacter larvae]